MKTILHLITAAICANLWFTASFAQNFTFDYNNHGQRVCLVESTVNPSLPSVTIHLLDDTLNTTNTTSIYRRQIGTNTWTNVATGIAAGTSSWTDVNVNLGEVWEYQIKRNSTWTYMSNTYDATGYTIGNLLNDKSDYQGQMILLIAQNVVDSLPTKVDRLKTELTGEGYYVNELIVKQAANWYSGDTVVSIKNQIQNIYNAAPANDKPKVLFILGHVPMPRSGSTPVTAPDGHNENRGARGADCYYADIDGIYTDTATYNPMGLVTPLAENLPGDYKWDQDFFPTDIEMAFGRVDFKDITDYSNSELNYIEQYLNRLSAYRNADSAYLMGNNTGFFDGYDNSNDGSFRSLPNISKAKNIIQKPFGGNHNQWVRNNGPFAIYMQNITVPNISEWNSFGMDATIFSSDQSYWGWNDQPQNFTNYSRIRSLLAADSKCLITLWTTSGINIFHKMCAGDNIGIALKDVMNHNNTNNYLEKPEQGFDEKDWWNRTHFAINGDPTVRLYQVKPASGLTVSYASMGAMLQWTASTDTSVIGYHVYKSTSQFGKFERLTNQIVSSTSFTDTTYQTSDWYMLRAIKIEETGCGQFYNPSLGIFAQGSFTSSIENYSKLTFELFPNPSDGNFTINSETLIDKIEVIDVQGKIIIHLIPKKYNTSINLSDYNSGLYKVKVYSKNSFQSKLLSKI